MKSITVYVVIRYPIELIGVYASEEDAKSAVNDYTSNNNNENEFYIESDSLTLF